MLEIPCQGSFSFRWIPGPVVQSVASRGHKSILARSHTFVEIDHEILSMIILLLLLIQEGLVSVTSKAKKCVRNTG